MKLFESAAAAILLAAAVSVPAVAAPISWAKWSSNTQAVIDAPGDQDVVMTYSGELKGLSTNYPSWGPASTFSDGVTVDNAPPQSGNMIQLVGGNTTVVDTITFTPAIVDPVFTFWSLGRASTTARFDFVNATPFLISGGPNAEFGGVSITTSGNSVLGAEANGTVVFHGTFSSISWTNPVNEDYYGITVGVTGTAAPEPGSALVVTAGAAVFAAGRRRRHWRRA